MLDDCLERHLHGESAEDCIRRYPAYAEDIREYLEIAGRFVATRRDWPSPEDKEQGRQRLLAEWEAIRRERGRRRA